MKKLSFFLLLFSALTSVFTSRAQNQPSDALLNLSGQASRSVSPDVAVVYFTITARDKNENDAMHKLNKSTDELVKKLSSLGYGSKDISMTGFNVSELFENYDPSKKNGYMASQSLILKFKYEREKLVQLFARFSAERTENLQFNLYAEVSKEYDKQVRKELIREALKNAEEKAEWIAAAARYKVRAVKQIDYNVPQYVEPVMMRGAMMEKSMSAGQQDMNQALSNFSFQPVEISESIQVVYFIEKL